jgi:hypothetical protein
MVYSRRTQELQGQIKKLERWASILGAFLLIMLFLMCGICMWLAENVFAYEVVEEKTKSEAYQHYIGEVDTYVCYTTTYGDCYHADYCGSLWNSKHETTVYEAKKDGYSSCSKCSPYEPTTLTLTETRYRDVSYKENTEKHPTFITCVVGYGLLFLLYVCVARPLDKKIDEAKTQLKKSIEEDRMKLLTM